MRDMKTHIITVKKLKKDGTIDKAISEEIAEAIKNGDRVCMPVDSIYGLVSVMDQRSLSAISRIAGEKNTQVVRMVSSFKMLNEIADINKMEFDFMHRIWPGELIVYVRDKKNAKKPIPVRMPRSRYQQDIIEHVGRPLAYATLYNPDRGPVYRKKELIQNLDGKIERMLIIDEFCKEHSLPSVVNISSGELVIVNEGRVSADEIKSLYFLGKDDSSL
jgi:tRNA threonylcarbamoyl adenosine modification protein (Sua5/YciO/YrdC/YwlC family)